MTPDATPAQPESTPASRRTRESIINAGIAVWSGDSSAPLGGIAQRAGVGRTTLHRHFADRAALIAAIDAEVRQRFAEAARRSRLDIGSGLAAYSRLFTELLRLDEPLDLIFADNALIDPDSWPDSGNGDRQLIARGHDDGSIDTALPAEWIQTVFWTTLFGARLFIRADTATLHETTELALRTLTRAIGAP